MKGIGGRHVVLNRILCVCVCVFAGDQRIVFSDIVIKINKRNKMQERILLITEAAIYNIDPGNFKVKRRIPISSVGGIKLSKLPDNFFCLHVPSEYDYLLVSSRKTEIVTNVIQYYEAATKSKLPVSFSNRYALWTSLWSMRSSHSVFSAALTTRLTRTCTARFSSRRRRAASAHKSLQRRWTRRSDGHCSEKRHFLFSVVLSLRPF